MVDDTDTNKIGTTQSWATTDTNKKKEEIRIFTKQHPVKAWNILSAGSVDASCVTMFKNETNTYFRKEDTLRQIG